MEVLISAEENGNEIMSFTMTFLDLEEGLGVARMLEAITRNHWLSSTHEKIRKFLDEEACAAKH